MEVKSASPPTGYVVASSVTSSWAKTTMSKSASSWESRQSWATSAGQRLVDRRADGHGRVEQDRGGRVGDGDRALGGHADHAFAQVVQQHLDTVALVLHLGEGAAQPVGHHVEGVGQLPDLVLHRLGHLGREVAAGDELGAALDALQPAGDEVRGHVAQDQADAQRQDRGEQQLALHGVHRVVHVLERRDDQDRGDDGAARAGRVQRDGRRGHAAVGRRHRPLRHSALATAFSSIG